MNGIDWEQRLSSLSDNSLRFVRAAGDFLAQPDEVLNQLPRWRWVSGLLDLGDESTRSILARRLSSHDPDPVLEPLQASLGGCAMFSHVRLVGDRVRRYFVTGLDARGQERHQLLHAFGPAIKELEDVVLEAVDSCKEAMQIVVSLASRKATLKGGVRAREVAADFLNFHALCSESGRSKTPVLTPKRSQGSSSDHAGPRMIDYSTAVLSRRPPWERAPVTAYSHRAQGMTRSPKGHRA